MLNDVERLHVNEVRVFGYGTRNLALQHSWVVVYDGPPFTELLLTDDRTLAKYVENKMRPHIAKGVEPDEAYKLAKQYAEDWVIGED